MNGQSPERIMDFVTNSVSSLGWELFDKDSNHLPHDAYTDAVVYFTKSQQTAEGYWRNAEGRRPPMNTGDYQGTAMAISTLKRYSSQEAQGETKQILAKAAAWLTKATPTTTQERSFQLLGLGWSGEATPAAIEKSAKALAATQREDGGWNQLSGMGSDAYATGQALYALHAAGKMPATDPVYKKGVAYLLRTQHPDGAWHVKTRSIWIQPYFESGFPYSHDQWISAAGTSWAAMALSLTNEPQKLSRR
jgi:hypothetical protein